METLLDGLHVEFCAFDWTHFDRLMSGEDVRAVWHVGQPAETVVRLRPRFVGSVIDVVDVLDESGRLHRVLEDVAGLDAFHPIVRAYR